MWGSLTADTEDFLYHSRTCLLSLEVAATHRLHLPLKRKWLTICQGWWGRPRKGRGAPAEFWCLFVSL